MQPTDVLILASALLAFALVLRRAEEGVATPPMAFTALGLLVGNSNVPLGFVSFTENLMMIGMSLVMLVRLVLWECNSSASMALWNAYLSSIQIAAESSSTTDSGPVCSIREPALRLRNGEMWTGGPH